MEDDHPSTYPRASARYDRDSEDLDSTEDDWDDWDDWYDEEDEEEPNPPAARVHDCGMDDPNWTAAFNILGLQARTCMPSYEPWQPQPSASTNAANGYEEWEPLQNDDPDDGSLVFGLHRFDPRNRGLDLTAEFRRCKKHKGRTLLIIGKTLLQFCDLDNSPADSTDDPNDSYRPAWTPEPESAQVIAPVLYVIASIPFLRNLVKLYLEYKERRQTVDTGPRKSSSLSSKPMSSTERKFNYRVGARDPSGSANTAVRRQFRPRPSLASSALLSPSPGTEQTVPATESGMASNCGSSTPAPPENSPVASRSTTPVDGSAEDRSTSTDGRDGTPLIPIPRRVRQKTPHHRVNFSEESSMSSPEADVAFDDSTDGSEVETTGVDTSNGSGSADMDIVTNSRIDRSIDTSSEDMDLVTLSPRSPESEPSFGNLPWTSTPQTNAPVKRDSEQDLSPSTNELFCVPTASERRANSKRTDVAVPLGRISVNPFIDTPGRQKGYGGAILAKGRTVVSVPRPQPEKKFRPKPHVVSQMQVAGRSAFTPEINRNLESPASPAPEPFRPQALVFIARSTTRVSPPNGPRGPRGPHEMPRAFDTPEANANPGRRQVPPAANVTPLRGEVRAPAHSTPLPIRGRERSLGSSTPGTSPRPLPVPPSSSSPLTPWERARPEDLSASDRRFQLENQTMFNDPTSPSPADWRRHPTPPRSLFEQVIRDSEPRLARRQQPAGPEPLEDDGVYWNG
ncbi:hypothetical protein QFC20_001911 [Naganishia adeliensis]|uniref:Uncharacterized protein n=1 Tax=Naganishia adeliensis TaxID=92952 RepID=A0ACC2WP58_9TREE|nr:hypothetical protein QFC20_001911 [Naganishia adeliensis]